MFIEKTFAHVLGIQTGGEESCWKVIRGVTELYPLTVSHSTMSQVHCFHNIEKNK